MTTTSYKKVQRPLLFSFYFLLCQHFYKIAFPLWLKTRVFAFGEPLDHL